MWSDCLLFYNVAVIDAHGLDRESTDFLSGLDSKYFGLADLL